MMAECISAKSATQSGQELPNIEIIPSIGTLQSLNLRYGCYGLDADAPSKHRWLFGTSVASAPLLEWPA
jgi:hypothetical protein